MKLPERMPKATGKLIRWEPAKYQDAKSAQVADYNGMRLYVYRAHKGAHHFVGKIDGVFVGTYNSLGEGMLALVNKVQE